MIKIKTATTRLPHTTIPLLQLQHCQRRLACLTSKSMSPTPAPAAFFPFNDKVTQCSKLTTRTLNTNANFKPNTNASPKLNTNEGTKPKSQPSDTELPVFDFKSLGLSGPIKVVVIAVICVLGTVETVFWVKVGWRWWNGEGEGEGRVGGVKNVNEEGEGIGETVRRE